MTGFVKQKFIRHQTSYKDANEELFSRSIITAGEGDSSLATQWSRSAAEWNQVEVGEGRIIDTLGLKTSSYTAPSITKENCSLPSGHRDLSQPGQENCRSQSHKRNNRSLQEVHFSHQNIGCFRSCGNFPHEIHVNLLINE